ncbi:acetyltransferase [Calothrix sp. NIES-4071]|nr:acetyltransferase [Calothrix sp. NIES-4071]BAZ60407.1 acetyltransferase [Calothrix sp. NIES-4105]
MATFRLYESSDYTAFEAMTLALYTEEIKGESMSAVKIANTVSKLTDEPNRGCIYIFENQGNLIGYSILIYFWSNEFGGEILNIDELFIKREYRGQGIGGKFFEFLSNEFKNKAVAFCLETNKGNNRAYNFYQKLGFREHKNTVLFKQF